MPSGGARIPGPGKRLGKALNPEERIWKKIDIRDGCWNYQGAISSNGYGAFWFSGQNRKPHRILWEIIIGPIPLGLELDHLCTNQICCRLDHLEPVTNKENNFRRRQKKCKRGHEYSIMANGKQRCYACKREKTKKLSEERLRVNPKPTDEERLQSYINKNSGIFYNNQECWIWGIRSVCLNYNKKLVDPWKMLYEREYGINIPRLYSVQPICGSRCVLPAHQEVLDKSGIAQRSKFRYSQKVMKGL